MKNTQTKLICKTKCVVSFLFGALITKLHSMINAITLFEIMCSIDIGANIGDTVSASIR